MTWGAPWWLWGLMLPLAAAVVAWRRAPEVRAVRRNIAQVECGKSLLRQRPGGRNLRVAAWLAWCLLVAALARPQWGEIERPVFEQGREVLLALDLSKSMLAGDVPPSRLERAKVMVEALLEELQGERVGLVVFAGTAFTQCPLSADYEILREFLSVLDPTYLPQGGTNYDAMLKEAVGAYSKEAAADRFLVILSDGESLEASWKRRLPDLLERKIRVIGLGVGTAAGGVIQDTAGNLVKDGTGAAVLTKLEPATLQELARETGGVYVDASRWVDLAEVIDRTVEMGKAGAFEERAEVIRVERYQWPLGAALVLMLWSLWREFPVTPSAQAVQRARTGTGRKTPPPPPKPVLAGVALSIWCAGVCTTTAQEARAVPPLAALVEQLSGKNTLKAEDYYQLATATMEEGISLRGQGAALPEGVVMDALEAVEKGKALKADAGDWSILEENLPKLLEKPPPRESDGNTQQGQEEDTQQQEGQGQNQAGQSQQNNESQNPEDAQQQGAEQPQTGEDGAQSQDMEPSPEQTQGDQSQSGQGNQEQQPQPREGGAMGSLEEGSDGEEEKGPPPGEPRAQEGRDGEEMQVVGGSASKPERPPGTDDPRLAEVFRLMEEVRGADSPAQLFQRMEGGNKPQRVEKDW